MSEPTAPAGPVAAAPSGMQQKAVTGMFWAAGERWVVRFSTLLAFVLLGRLLSPVEFGVVALAMTIISVLALATDAGFSSWLIQKRDLTDRSTSTAFWVSVTLGVVLSLGLVAVSGVVADALDSQPLRLLLPALSVTMLVSGLSSVPVALLQRDLDFRALAVRQVTATVVSVVVAVALALAGAGVWALVAQHLVRVVVAGVMLWTRTPFRPRLVVDRAEAREMTAFGTRSLGVQMGSAVRDQGASFVIGAIVGTVALGYWTVAGRLVAVVAELCAAAVGTVALSVFAGMQGERERLDAVFRRVSGAGALIIAPALVAMSLASRDLLPLVFGSQWVPSAAVASVLAIAVLGTTLADPHRALLMGTGRAGVELTLTTVAVVGQLVVIVVLADRGLLVVATGVAAWAVLMYPVRVLVLRLTAGVSLRAHAQVLAVLLAAGLAAAAVLGVEALAEPEGALRLLVVVAVGGLVYAPAAYLLARPTVDDVVSSGLRALRARRGRAATPDPTPATREN